MNKRLLYVGLAFVGLFIAGGINVSQAEFGCPSGQNKLAVKHSGVGPYICRTSTCRNIGTRVSQRRTYPICLLGICMGGTSEWDYEVGASQFPTNTCAIDVDARLKP